MLFQKAFSQTNAFWGDFHQLIVIDELHTVFKCEIDGGRDLDRIFFA